MRRVSGPAVSPTWRQMLALTVVLAGARDPDRHRQREQQRLGPVAFAQAVDQEDHRHHRAGEPDQQPAHAVDAGLKRVRQWVGRADARREVAEIAGAAGRADQRSRGARHHVGAHEDQLALRQRCKAVADALHELLDRQRPADQRGLEPGDGRRGLVLRQSQQIVRHRRGGGLGAAASAQDLKQRWPGEMPEPSPAAQECAEGLGQALGEPVLGRRLHGGLGPLGDVRIESASSGALPTQNLPGRNAGPDGSIRAGE